MSPPVGEERSHQSQMAFQTVLKQK